ncbi:MAG: sigma-70 family RNA polymerase sigma factor [Acidobacteriota bacterium]|nr:sigma-70 family RNA polymerase sigma factor [Acidobacteriota bacterium]
MSGTEARLIAQAKQGDTNAFRQIVEANSRNVFGLAFRMLGNEAEAEDVVQETFLRAWKNLDKFDGRSALSTWLFRIASNRALDLIRSRARADHLAGEEAAAHLDAAPETAPSPEQNAYAGQLGRRIHAGLDGLTHQERTAFVLRHCQDFSVAEVSKVLDTSVNTAKQAIFRAVRKLRAALSTGVTS